MDKLDYFEQKQKSNRFRHDKQSLHLICPVAHESNSAVMTEVKRS
jgi:hypothetical protein